MEKSCFCKKEELEGMKRVVAGKEISIYDKRCLKLSKEEVQRRLDAGEPHVIRFNMPTEGTTTFHDVIYGDITVNNEELEDLILIKSDGYPTYNFANVIDDHLMEITHVVRGNEYLSSAPKYNRIYEAFGWDIPVYVHCPLIKQVFIRGMSTTFGKLLVCLICDQRTMYINRDIPSESFVDTIVFRS